MFLDVVRWTALSRRLAGCVPVCCETNALPSLTFPATPACRKSDGTVTPQPVPHVQLGYRYLYDYERSLAKVKATATTPAHVLYEPLYEGSQIA